MHVNAYNGTVCVREAVCVNVCMRVCVCACVREAVCVYMCVCLGARVCVCIARAPTCVDRCSQFGFSHRQRKRLTAGRGKNDTCPARHGEKKTEATWRQPVRSPSDTDRNESVEN